MEIKGFTAVDSTYEFFGYSVGHDFYRLLSGIHLPAMLAVAGLCLVFWRAMGKGSWGSLVGYVLYLVVALWLITPTDVSVGPPWMGMWAKKDASGNWYEDQEDRFARDYTKTIRAPRFLAYTHWLTDNVVRIGVSNASANFQTAAYHWVRIAAASREARILDADLRRRFARFTVDCYMPALARYPKTDETLYPTQEPDGFLPLYENLVTSRDGNTGIACRDARAELAHAIEDHVGTNSHHSKIIASYTSVGNVTHVNKHLWEEGYEESPMTAVQFKRYYIRRLIYNETYNYTDATETELVDKAIPPYNWTDTSQNTHGYASDKDKGFFEKAWQGIKSLASQAIRGVAGIAEWVDQQASGPMLYYRVTMYAPYVYGLVLMIVIVAWPIPGIWSLWPGQNPEHSLNFHPLLNYLKLFISVKLWPFWWSLLASFNTARQWLPGDGATGAQGDEMYHAFSSIAALYVIIPAFSFLIIQLTAKAGSLAIASFGGMGAPGAGGGVGMANQAEKAVGQYGLDKAKQGYGWIKGLAGGGGGAAAGTGGSAGAGGGGGAPPAAAA